MSTKTIGQIARTMAFGIGLLACFSIFTTAMLLGFGLL